MPRIFLIWPSDISKQSALYPPLGLASLAAVMRERGYDVRVIDLSFDENWEQVHCHKGENGIFGLSFTSSMYSNAKKCIQTIREKSPKAKVVLGGAHPSVLPEETLQEMQADVVCIGEAERSFPLVVDALIRNSPLASVKGIAFKDEQGKITVNPGMEMIDDLDSLPMPDQSLFPHEMYFKIKGFRELSIITSRGCPGRCVFCQPAVQKMFGRKIRQHGCDYVIRQIQSLKKEYKLDFFVISDDTFTANRKWVKEFCEKIVAEKTNMFWRCQTRVDFLDREIIRQLKRAGCFIVALGVESGSQEILEGLKKNLRVEQIKRIFKICHEEGMLTHAYLMIGSPGENRQTIEATRKLLREIKPFSSNICVTTPYPGTALFDKVNKDAEEEDSIRRWDLYDHLLSDTLHLPIPGFDLTVLNESKKILQDAQRYRFFRLRCLGKTFINKINLRRLVRIVLSNPGIILRGMKLFWKSMFSKGLELSNPRTKANQIYSIPQK